jgi:methylase of polypeptide subunit release factors
VEAVEAMDVAQLPAPVVLPGAVAALREDLAGFTVEAVTHLLGPVAHAALGREQPIPAVLAASRTRDTAGPDLPLATLVTAFVLGRPVTRRHLNLALPRLGIEGAERLGLVATAGTGPDDDVIALADLQPYAAVDALGTADWWVLSDLTELATHRPLRHDHVLGIGGASTTLAACTVRGPVDRALDLGTGCGVQALHATRHARVVTATDISPRALAFARFTLELNGLTERVRLVEGDLLDPVRDERFDLVVSNPPFVITPRRPDIPAYEYRDGGRTGDDVVRHLIEHVGDVLAPGGVAQLLGNWEHRRGELWTERVSRWLADSGLDAWIVQREVQDPAEYAELWIRDGGRPDPATSALLYRAWLEDFAARDVEAIGFGLILLRRPRRGGPTLRRVEEVTSSGHSALGGHLASCLDAHDWLRTVDDGGLSREHLRVADDVTEERYHRPGDDDPQVVLLRQGGGFGRTVRADTALAGFVGACDGELSAGQVIGALAHLLQQPAADLAADLLPRIRALLADGFLAPSPS